MSSKYKEMVLIEIFKDKELDVFGVYRKRRLDKVRQEKFRKEKEKLRYLETRRNENYTKFCKIITKRLINIYGKEDAINYLKALFKEIKC